MSGDMHTNAEDETVRRNLMASMRETLDHLASPAATQIAIYPDFVSTAVELREEFDDVWIPFPSFVDMNEEQQLALSELEGALDDLHGDDDAWTEGALGSNAGWQRVRSLAARALITFGWTSRGGG